MVQTIFKWPFYDVSDYDIIEEKLLHSERPYIDPRYFTDNNTFIERHMIEIMKMMWDDHPQNRPTMFDVVDFLSNVQHQVLDGKVNYPHITPIPRAQL